MRSCEHSEQECSACWKDRIGSIQIGQGSTPSRTVRKGDRPKDRPNYNDWEKGRPTDSRGMPYLDSHGAAVGVKKLAETRHNYRQFDNKITVK